MILQKNTAVVSTDCAIDFVCCAGAAVFDSKPFGIDLRALKQHQLFVEKRPFEKDFNFID